MSAAVLADLSAQVRDAAARQCPLKIIGGNSKHDWWQTSAVDALNLSALTGIIKYEPSELVIRAYAGTRVAEIEAALFARGQILAFEPPHTGATATLGGAVATGLSGPARPYRGALRDFVLGVGVMNDTGEVLQFGGDVMKNVAGYDVARLITGAWGRLGPIVEVALRVMPQSVTTCSLSWRGALDEALQRMRELQARALPLSALAFADGTMHVRLSGTAAAVETTAAALNFALSSDADTWWSSLRDFSHPFFTGRRPLWRIMVPPATAALALGGDWLIDWGGALRWYRGENPPAEIMRIVSAAHGNARRWPHARGELAAPLATLTERIVRSFDPNGLFNPLSSGEER